MDNRTIAQMLGETADLLEISGGDSFRIRSYRRAAEAVEQSTVELRTLLTDPKRLQEIPGIGKGMAANILSLEATGSMPVRDELLARYKATMLELLKLPGMGPKTVAFLWEALEIGDVEALAKAIDEGKLEGLPRFGAKQIEKLRKGVEEYRRNVGRFHLDDAEDTATRITDYLMRMDGVDRVVPAGSLRRGRETVGDLDLLVTGPACEPDRVEAVVEHTAAYSGIADLLAKGQNKVSFRMRNGLQVDVRMLPEASFGAALQYFTGSKMHNVALRQRALKHGYTLNEYALSKLEGGETVAAATEEEVYVALGLSWIPPELRENQGEMEAAENNSLPRLIELGDIRGDLHMHTDATDGRNTIREMAEAALARGYQYIAITDHSKNLAMTNGLDDERALRHMERIRETEKELDGRIRILPGIEVDILDEGELDLSDNVLAQMDVVIASVHSLFNQTEAEMTARLLRAIENPYVRVIGHMTGRLLLRREAYRLDTAAVLKQAASLGVAVEHNAHPNRLDLCDRDLRLARELGCRIVINTDSHQTSNMALMKYGIQQLRRAWLTPADVLNTKPVDEMLSSLRPRPVVLNGEK